MKPQFHPVSKIPLFEEAINGMLEASEEQHENLTEAKGRPHVLDNYTVEKLINAYREQKGYFKFYKEQFSLWKKEQLTDIQKAQLTEMTSNLNQIEYLNAEILNIADDLKSKTIENILEKDDAELAFEFLDNL